MFRELNEQLEKFIIDELSYETKKSYLQKMQARLKAAQDKMDKAQRLVRDTEDNKETKRTLSMEKIEEIAQNIRQEITFKGKPFYTKAFVTWVLLKAGSDVDEGYPNCCQIVLGLKDNDNKYLQLNLEHTDDFGKRSETTTHYFALDDFNFFKLNKKVLSTVKNYIKQQEIETNKNSKSVPKLEKAEEELKKILSRYKQDKLDPENNARDKKVASYLKPVNVRENYPVVVSIKGVTFPNKRGYQYDYQIYAVGLTSRLDVALFYCTEDNPSIRVNPISGLLSTSPEDKLIAVNKIINILKADRVGGKSNLKARQQELENKKELAEKAINDLRNALRSVDRNANFGSIQKDEHGYTFSVRDWGEWGDSEDWEEDNDFMRLTDEWDDKRVEITKQIQKQYPNLKVFISQGEKRYLDCSVDW